MKEIFKECVQNSTAHGIPHLNSKENGAITKAVWILIVLSASGVFLLHSSSLVIKYFKYETSVSVKLDGTHFIPPDIFICNMIPFSYALMNYNLFNENKDFKNLSKFIDGKLRLAHKLRDYGFIKEFSSEFVDHILSNRNFTDIISVNFNNVTYFKDLFTRVPNSMYRSCYKINSQYKKHMYKKDTFYFVMYTDTHWFTNEGRLKWSYQNDSRLFLLENFRKSMRLTHMVYITPANHYPHADSLTIPIELGKITDIHINMELHRRVNSENTPCRQDPEKITYFNPLDGNDPIEYDETPIDCLYQHFQKEMLKNERCLVSNYPATPQQWNNGKVTFCTKSFKTLEETVMEKKLSTYPYCKKLATCEVPVYSANVHKWKLNSDEIKLYVTSAYSMNKTLYEDLWNKFNEKKTGSRFGNWDKHLKRHKSIENSFVQLSFYVPNMLSTVYTESFSYELKSLLSDIGGILGFYLGVSFVTLFELLAHTVKYVSQSSHPIFINEEKMDVHLDEKDSSLLNPIDSTKVVSNVEMTKDFIP